MLVGYARVSTDNQSVDLQKEALEEAGCEQIYTETTSGKSSDRPVLRELIDSLREGDTLAVWRLDRLGRSVEDLIGLVARLGGKGVRFKSLTEVMDVTTAGGRLMFHMSCAFAEFERDVTSERTQAGLTLAKERGRKGGRKKALSGKLLETAYKMYDSRKHTVREICESMDIKERTFYEYLKRRKDVSMQASNIVGG